MRIVMIIKKTTQKSKPLLSKKHDERFSNSSSLTEFIPRLRNEKTFEEFKTIQF